MPFQSEKQKGYLLAHPEITDKKGRPVGKKWAKKYGKGVSKSKRGYLEPLVIGTAAGAAANQFPRVQDMDWKKKKKGKITKALTPEWPDDGWFNAEAAQKAYEMVMKMDIDTAEMFTQIVAADLFEEDIEKNLRTLQGHLNLVLEQRAVKVRKALERAISKSDDEQAAQYRAVLEEISKAPRTPQYYGYDWEESDFRRDPGTGRFMVKVKHTMKKPLDKQTSSTVIGSHGPDQMKPAERARYQDEYRQVAQFLDMVGQTQGQGNVDVVYHLQDSAGNRFSALNNSGAPPEAMLADANTKLIAMEAKPNTLTAGGAAFGLASAMGRSMTPDQMNRANYADKQFGDFAENWANAGDKQNQNTKLFNRMQTAGNFIQGAAPPGSKTQMAGKFAEIVGQRGPEAEKVIGPSARKAAYRYRGTEKAPDLQLIRAYSREISDAKRTGVSPKTLSKPMQDFIEGRTPMGPGETGIRGQRVMARPTPETAPAISQMGRAREGEAERAAREPNWAERGRGAAKVAEYLTAKLPDKHLYRLHLEAGNTPPSEGVIINSKGQLASQAVGYGDDHYLPFNLKNLKDLKGGEYIRNRSVGGLTSEDIYTGLISGARRVTVVSRSGTFTMEFEPDFRGGRRHNDKARRMTRRYEQLLDAVQSGQVDRATIPKAWRKAIEDEVRAEMAGYDKAQIRDEITAQLKEFKENPEIEGRDLDRAEAMIADFENKVATGEVRAQDSKDYRTQVMNELHNMKEVKFRLNGVGYEAALKSLEEQFPYYITTSSKPTRDEELLEFEVDEGYVEPGRNRPSKARAGLHSEGPEGKYSAKYADYQRGKVSQKKWAEPGKAAATTATGASGDISSTSGAEDATSQKKREQQKVADFFAQETKVEDAANAAWKLFHNTKQDKPDFSNEPHPEWWEMEETTFKDWVAQPKNSARFHAWNEKRAEQFSDEDDGLPRFGASYQKYLAARGALNPVPYQKTLASSYPPFPLSFASKTGPAYHAGAREADIRAVHRVLDKEPLLTSRKKLSELNDAERETEIKAVRSVRSLLEQEVGANSIKAALRQKYPGAPHDAVIEPLLSSNTNLDSHLERIHESRYVESMRQYARGPSGPKPTATRPAAGGGGGQSPGQAGGPPKSTPGGGGPELLVETEAPPAATPARQKYLAASDAAVSDINMRLRSNPSMNTATRDRLIDDRNQIKAFTQYVVQNPHIVEEDDIKAEMAEGGMKAHHLRLIDDQYKKL